MNNVNGTKLQTGGVIEAVKTEQKEIIRASTGMLRVRSANDVLKEAAEQPDPTLFFDQLIIQGELTICFADTGIGKTVYAVQIAAHIAESFNIVVLYIDLELSDKQFQKRYTDDSGKLHKFPEKLKRADYTPILEIPKSVSYEEFFLQSLIESIKDAGAQVVVIDNMTKLSSGDTDSAKNTIPVMEGLSKIKRDQGITFLLLEHNRKTEAGRPISLNDLQGSKFKSNFADAVFTIGRSTSDKHLRYVKQLKVRSAELIYDIENVATYQVSKDGSMLSFYRIGNGNEYSFLHQDTKSMRADKKQRATELRAEGLSFRKIAKELGVSDGTVRNLLSDDQNAQTEQASKSE